MTNKPEVLSNISKKLNLDQPATQESIALCKNIESQLRREIQILLPQSKLPKSLREHFIKILKD